MDCFSEDCFEVTREAMLHLGINTSTQNNIFQVREKSPHVSPIFGRDDRSSLHQGLP